MDGFRVVLAAASAVIAFIAVFIVRLSEFKKEKRDYPSIKYYVQSLLSGIAVGAAIFVIMGIL